VVVVGGRTFAELVVLVPVMRARFVFSGIDGVDFLAVSRVILGRTARMPPRFPPQIYKIRENPYKILQIVTNRISAIISKLGFHNVT
jgi:hypothetical protein